MEIDEISQEHYDSLAPPHDEMRSAVQMCGWFASEGETLLGVVMRDLDEPGFLLVVQGRDEEGFFQVVAMTKVGVSYATQDEAEAAMVAAMERVRGSGQTVFPQRR